MFGLRLQPACNTVLSAIALLFFFAATPESSLADFLAVQWGTDSDLLRISKSTGEIIERLPTSASALNALTRSPSGEIHTIQSFPAPGNEPFFGIARGVAALGITQNGDALSVESRLITPTYFDNRPIRVDVRGMAYDSQGKLYAILNGGEENSLATIDVSTGNLLGIGPTGRVQSLAFSSEDVLYTYDLEKGLGTVDVATGAFNDIAPEIDSELPAPSIQTLAFDSSGQLFGAGSDLYRIDIETGEVTLVGGDQYDIRGMVFVVPEPLTAVLAALALSASLVGRRRDVVS